MIIWALGQFPQLLKLYTLESIAGISIYFLVLRFIGDIMYLVNYIIIASPLGNRTLISYFCFIDTVLLLQYWYYWDKSNLGENGETTPLRVPENSRRHSSAHSTTNNSYNLNSSSWWTFLVLFFVSTNAFPVGKAFHQNITSDSNSSTSQFIPDEIFSTASFPIVWASVVCFVGARVFQIRENYTAKTMTLSIYFVALYVVGALFYLASLLLDLWLLIIGLDDNLPFTQYGYFIEYLPYIIGAMGTIIGDSIIVRQYFIYRPVESAIEPVQSYHFKPDWYAPSFGKDNEIEDDNNSVHIVFDEPNKTMLKRLEKWLRESGSSTMNLSSLPHIPRSEVTESDYLLKWANPSYSTPPPPHYVSFTSKNTPDLTTRHSGILSQLGKSFTNSYKNTGSYISISSPKNATPISTSLLPSIIGNYSKVGRKMSNDARIPFSPSDFLTGETIEDNEGSSTGNQTN